MNKTILKEFAELKIQQSEIEDRIAELKPVILEEMKAEQLDKIPTSLGNLSIKKKKNWKYSGAVDILKADLDQQKEQEESDGTATFTEMDILEFRQVKK